MEMNCSDIHSYLNRYIDGEVSGRRQRLITAHLATCESCRTMIAGLKQIEEALLSEPMADMPAELSGEVVQEAQNSLASFQVEASKSGNVQVALPESVEPAAGAEQPAKDKRRRNTNNPPTPLRRVGPYNVYECIGKGAMGKVYKAFDPALNRPVAIKEIRPEIARNEKLIKRFLREARLVARLHHENICSLYFLGTNEESGSPYIAMEFVDGVTLEHIIQRDGPLPPMRAVEVFRQVAVALQEALRHEVIHRDVKPANMMLGRGGRVKVTDFGLAKALDVDSDLTSPNSLVGTPHYLAPEAGTGSQADCLSDIYALGVSLFYSITGKLPYDGPNALLVFDKQRKSPVPDVREIKPTVPAHTALLVSKMMAKDRKERPGSYEELVAEFDLILGGGAQPLLAPSSSLSEHALNSITRIEPNVIQRVGLFLLVGVVVLASLFHLVYLPDTPSAELGKVVKRQTPRPEPTKTVATVLPSSTPSPVVTKKPVEVPISLVLLHVSSEPSGCLVEEEKRNGERTPIGTTHRPFVTQYRPGDYKFRFSKMGYGEKFVTVKLGDKKTVQLSASLKQQMGTLAIEVNPRDAIVQVDGLDVKDRSHLQGMRLMTGTHKVAARLFGYEKTEETVTIESNKTTRVNLHLKRLLSPLTVTTLPSPTGRPLVPLAPLVIKVVSIAGASDSFTAAISYKGRDYLVEKGWISPDQRIKVTHIDENKVTVKDLKTPGQPLQSFYF